MGIYTHIQAVPGGMCQTSGECSLWYPKLNGYGDNGQRSLKLWQLLLTYWLPNTYWNWQEYVVSVMLIAVRNIKVTCEWHKAFKLNYKNTRTRVTVVLRLSSTLRRPQLICFLVTSEQPSPDCSVAHKPRSLHHYVWLIGQAHWTSMTSRTATLHYVDPNEEHTTLWPLYRNRSNLDIGVLGYIGIVKHKEQSPEVWHNPPGTPCMCSTLIICSMYTCIILLLCSMYTCTTLVLCSMYTWNILALCSMYIWTR